MNITEEFYDFCLYLHQDYTLYGPKPQDWIDGALRHMDKERRSALKDYLDGLLSGDYSDAQLQEIYRSTDTELRIWDDRGVRLFLEMVRDTIDRKV